MGMPLSSTKIDSIPRFNWYPAMRCDYYGKHGIQLIPYVTLRAFNKRCLDFKREFGHAIPPQRQT